MAKARVSKEQKQRVAKLLQELYSAKEKFDAANAEYKGAKEQLSPTILRYMQTTENKAVRTNSSGGDGFIRAVSCQNTKVIYSVERMEQKLDNGILNDILDKTITISDWDKFAKVLRNYGVPLVDVRSLLEVDKQVNERRLEQAIDLGVVTWEDLTGCYKIQNTSDPYLRLTFIEPEPESEGGESDGDGESWF